MNISLVIPSRNNLKYVKFAYDSIRENLDPNTEIILLDDASTDGTWEWMNDIASKDVNVQIYRNNGSDRVGHTILYDKGAHLSKNEVFGIFHADMVATPNYLTNMVKHLKRGVVVCATRIEPPLHPPGPEKLVENFGIEPEEFDMVGFLQFVSKQEKANKDKTTEGIFAPWIMYKDDFFAINGHDKNVFAPMELEDSDLFNRFLLKGYKFVQARDAFCYHLTCRGSRFKDGIIIENKIPISQNITWYKPHDSEEYTTLRQIKFGEWWRKWHMNVLHDSNMKPIVCKRYDVGYIVDINNFFNTDLIELNNKKGNEKLEYIHKLLVEKSEKTDIIKLYMIEPWCDDLFLKIKINDFLRKNEFYIEKQLQSIIQKKLNCKFNLSEKIKIYDPEIAKNNILIEFDINKFTQQHYKFIEDLMFTIESTNEIGEFEYDIFKITINSLQSYEHHLIDSEDEWYLNKLVNPKKGVDSFLKGN